LVYPLGFDTRYLKDAKAPLDELKAWRGFDPTRVNIARFG
jgi:hypothetical protein